MYTYIFVKKEKQNKTRQNAVRSNPKGILGLVVFIEQFDDINLTSRLIFSFLYYLVTHDHEVFCAYWDRRTTWTIIHV